MKKIIFVLMLLSSALITVGCVPSDLATPTYNYADITLPDGKVVSGKISSYHEEFGRYNKRVNIVFSNGRVYNTEMSNVVLSRK